MRIHPFSIALLFLAGVAPVLDAQNGTKNAAAAPAVELVFELDDGSRLIGTPSVDGVGIKTQFTVLNLAFSKVRSIEFDGADHAAQVDFQNGDVLKGELVTREIAADTAIGNVTVPMARVSRIFVRVRVASTDGGFVNSLGMEFVPVPGTEALFCIWDTRVKDFEAFFAATGYDATGGMLSIEKGAWGHYGDTWRKPGFEQGATHPVVGVSWEDAEAFCKWLTEKERKEKKIRPDQEYRLPTDEEWSTAVGLPKEAGDTPAARDMKIAMYPWGKQWPPPAGAGNYKATLGVDDYARTSPVGSFEANRYGLYDMGGNVWQWCEDWWDGTHTGRVLRGASWDDDDSPDLLSSHHGESPSNDRRSNHGFRVVLAAGASQ